jgi:uncharacterized protein with WD repeat
LNIHIYNNENKMPHTTTKIMRSKRPDTRPNGEMRKRIAKRIEEGKTIQDIRVTRKRKGEIKEREVQMLPLKKLDTKSENEKVLRALKKKLRSIDSLIKLQEAGVQLDEQQLLKVDSLDQVMKEMQELIGFEIPA